MTQLVWPSVDETPYTGKTGNQSRCGEMVDFRTWMGRRHGATATETLLVVLFAAVLIGGALMVFGPTLAKKYTFAAKMMGVEDAPRATMADAQVRRSTTNPLWYVLYTALVVIFFAAFIAPMLFPRARHTRQEIIFMFAERFPILQPLIDRDAMVERGMGELRGLAAEVNALERHKAKALDIQPHDFGKMALPSEQTVDASFSEMPDLEAMLGGPGAPPSRSRSRGRSKDASLKLGAAGQSDDTQMAIPLSQRLQAIGGDDEIPFDAIDPSVKPQLQGLQKPMVRNPSRPMFVRPGDESATVDVNTEEDLFANSDALAAQILRESGSLRAAPIDADATIVHNSQPLHGVAHYEAETGHVDSLPTRMAKSGPLDSTTPDNARKANALDATTQDFDSYDAD